MAPATSPSFSSCPAQSAANEMPRSEAPSLADTLQTLTIGVVALGKNLAIIVEEKLAGHLNKGKLLEIVLACLKGDT
jgi:hypothetical protein